MAITLSRLSLIGCVSDSRVPPFRRNWTIFNAAGSDLLQAEWMARPLFGWNTKCYRWPINQRLTTTHSSNNIEVYSFFRYILECFFVAELSSDVNQSTTVLKHRELLPTANHLCFTTLVACLGSAPKTVNKLAIEIWLLFTAIMRDVKPVLKWLQMI